MNNMYKNVKVEFILINNEEIKQMNTIFDSKIFNHLCKIFFIII